MKLKNIGTHVLAVIAGCAIAWVARELSHLVTIDIGEIPYDEDPEEDEADEVFLDRLAEEMKLMEKMAQRGQFSQYFSMLAEVGRGERTIEDVEAVMFEHEAEHRLQLAQQALDEGHTLRSEQVELLLRAEGLAQRVRDETTAPSVGKSLDNMVSIDSSGVVMEKKPGDPDIITEAQVHIDKPRSERLLKPPPSPTAQEARLDPEWDEELRQASELDYTGGRRA